MKTVFIASAVLLAVVSFAWAQSCNVNSCNFAKAVAAPATITFTRSGYTPPCVTIDVGGTITFSGSFSGHPLAAGSPSSPSTVGPFTPTRSTGDSAVISFPSEGVFPYYCTDHSNMIGVVYVGKNSTTCDAPAGAATAVSISSVAVLISAAVALLL